METSNENLLILRILGGEKSAYAHLIHQYKTPVFNLAYRMTGSYEEADDMTQEVFITAYQKLKHFDPQKKFFPWFYTIALNILRNHLRKNKGRTSSQHNFDRGADIEISGDSPEQMLIEEQESQKLDRCLRKLPQDIREAIILKFYLGLTFEEISEISGKSLSATKMRIYRGLRQLRSLIGDF